MSKPHRLCKFKQEIRLVFLIVSRVYVDKLRTGFLVWTGTVKGYLLPDNQAHLVWEKASSGVLDVVDSGLRSTTYYQDILSLWGQESNGTGSINLRAEHLAYIKRLGQTFLCYHFAKD